MSSPPTLTKWTPYRHQSQALANRQPVLAVRQRPTSRRDTESSFAIYGAWIPDRTRGGALYADHQWPSGGGVTHSLTDSFLRGTAGSVIEPRHAPDASNGATTAGSSAPSSKTGDASSGAAGEPMIVSRPPEPAARRGHSLCLWTHPVTGAPFLILFGGAGHGDRGENTPLSDVWSFDVEANAWTELRPRVPQYEGRSALNSPWVSLADVEKAEAARDAGDINHIPVPPPRSSHGAVVLEDALYVFGGASPRGTLNGAFDCRSPHDAC